MSLFWMSRAPEAARKGLRRLGGIDHLEPMQFRAYALGGMWDEAAQMIPEMTDTAEEMLGVIEQVGELMQQMPEGAQPPAHLLEGIIAHHGMAAGAHASILLALGEVIAHGPPEARNTCLDLGTRLAKDFRSRLQFAEAVLDSREDAEEIIAQAKKVMPPGDAHRLALFEVLVRASWDWKDDAVLEEACQVLWDTHGLSRVQKSEVALDALQSLATLAEDERRGVTGVYG